jgi:isomerase DpgB
MVKGGNAMTGLENLTEVHLRIDSHESLSTRVIAEVNSACDRVEDAEKDVILLVHLRGEQAVGAEPWPHDLGIHPVNQWERAVRRLERLTAPTLAVVEGDCRGLALEALLATDYRIAAPDATLRLSSTAEGTWPGMSLYRLANQLSVGLVRRMALFGVPVGAAEAAELGLVDAVADDVEAAARAALEVLGAGRGKEIAIRRRLLLDATSTSFEDALGSHLAACDRALRLSEAGLDAGTGL